MNSAPKFQPGLTFYSRSWPVLPLTVASVEQDGQEWRYRIESRNGFANGFWNAYTEAELEQEMLPVAQKDEIIVIPGNIPASSLIVFKDAVFSVCYLSDEKGCSLHRDSFRSPDEKHRQAVFQGGAVHPHYLITEGELQRLQEVANNHHHAIFRGRNAAMDYKRTAPFIVAFSG